MKRRRTFLYPVMNLKPYREKPHDEEWNKLDDMKVPFLLNYAQCKLYAEEYYEVIEHTSEVLKRHPGEFHSLVTVF